MTQTLSPFSGEKILIADDDDVIAQLAALLLQRRGFRVFRAADGEECLRMVAEHRPALVLLDYMMPVMNGLDALKLIRAQYSDSYVVMFTGRGSEEVAVEVMKAGAIDYLQKPFASQNLSERIDNVLSRRQIELENRRLLEEREQLQEEIQKWNVELEERVRQKSSELEQAQKEIIQAEKMATLGHVSAGLAHEIRNPLNSINLFVQILLADPDIVGENRDYLSKITNEVERIDNILVKILAASPGEIRQKQSVMVDAVIMKVLSSLQSQIEAQNVDLELELTQGGPPLAADPLAMEQIFSNLLGNALYEMPKGGTLKVTMQRNDEKLQIRIADSGQGIPEENFSRIFDPFFTTKIKGTGFGLSVVLRNVNSCGGRIWVDSAPGEGACFAIELPLSSGDDC